MRKEFIKGTVKGASLGLLFVLAVLDIKKPLSLLKTVISVLRKENIKLLVFFPP